MTPAGRLRAAAQKILDTAAWATTAANGTPWEVNGKQIVSDSGGTREIICSTEYMPDTAWIVLLGPDKAQHLAAWFEATARGCDRKSLSEAGPYVTAALAFADSILGDTE